MLINYFAPTDFDHTDGQINKWQLLTPSLFMIKPSNLLFIPYQLAMVQTTSLNVFETTHLKTAMTFFKKMGNSSGQITNNNEKFRSFKSKENFHKKEAGPYHGFG